MFRIIRLSSVIALLLAASAAAAQTRQAGAAPQTDSPAPAAAGLSEEAARRLGVQAEECVKSFVDGDYERLASYTYPKVVEMMGGHEKMAAFVKNEVEKMKAEGFEVLSYVSEAPTQVVRVARDTYAIIPATLRMRAPGGMLVSESFMIAISSDDGKNWKFVSGSGAGPDKLKLLFPAAMSRLKLPTIKPPTFQRNP